jgi:hypothetical protein
MLVHHRVEAIRQGPRTVRAQKTCERDYQACVETYALVLDAARLLGMAGSDPP